MLSALVLLVGLVLVPASPAAAKIDSARPSVGWRPLSGSFVYAIARVGDLIVMGGSFTTMVSANGTQAPRQNLAAISASTGALLPWAPNPNGVVQALTPTADGRGVYVGGQFTRIGGAARTNVAAVSVSGAVTGFQSGAPNGAVRALMLHNGRLYIGGMFTKIGSTYRGNGAELDPVSGALRAWNPRADWGIYTMTPTPDGVNVVIGGRFRQVDGHSRPFLAIVDRQSGKPTSWVSGSTCKDPSPVDPKVCEVFGVVTDSRNVFAAVGGPGGRVTALSLSSGSQRWWAGTDGDVQAIAISGSTLYAGGHYTDAFSGVPRAGLAALNKDTGRVIADDATTPMVGGTGVWAILVDQGVLRVGGRFSLVGGVRLPCYTSFRITDYVAPRDTTAPSAPGQPTASEVRSDLVTLTWGEATDNVGVSEYRVRRNGVQIATTSGRTFTDRTVKPSTTYSYSVVAADEAGNVGASSAWRSVTTPAAAPAPKPPAKNPPQPAPPPAVRVAVAVSRAGYGNVLHVDVNPNRKGASYMFTVQRLGAARAWSALPGVYRTTGTAATRSVPLPAGVYRVVVRPSAGYKGAVSAAVALTPPTARVKVTTDKAKNKLKVNVDPNLRSGAWSFKVQKRTAQGAWAPAPTVWQTKGAGETRTLNLPRGTYRVVVVGKAGYRGVVSGPVSLAR